MGDNSEFVSVFKVNGRPILPPAMTPRRRKEMQEYKMKAMAVEQRLKEKKKEQREHADILVQPDEDGNKENEETESAFQNINGDPVFDGRCHVKSVLSERESLKELVPQFLQKNIAKNSTVMHDLQSYGEYQEEACSVALTESTDLHPYLNSSLEDEICSSEADFSTECACAPKHSAEEACCDTVEYKVSGGEDIEVGFIKHAPLSECRASNVSNFSSKESNVMNTTKVIKILDSQLIEDIAGRTEVDDLTSSCTISGFYKSEVKLLEANVEDNNDEEDECNYTSFPSSHSPPASVSANNNHVDNRVTELQETCNDPSTSTTNNCLLHSQLDIQPVRLIRTGSFTMETPSPLLIANIEQFTVDAVLQGGDSPSKIVENKTIGYIGVNNSEALSAHCVSSENLKSLPVAHPKDDIDIHQGKGAKAGGILKTRKPSIANSKRESMKGGIQKGTVFERLAADAAKKAEERRKLSRKNDINIFKVPKKVTKTASRGMRPAVSASNLRISLSGVHKSRSNALACRRSNSEANVSTAHRKGVLSAANASQKKSTMAQVASAPFPQKQIVVNERSLDKDVEHVVSTSEDTQPLQVNKDLQLAGISDEYGSSKVSANHFNNAQAIEALHLKKIMYSVQTSPISPPFPHQSNASTDVGSEYADGESTALQGGRRRRRWSVGWSGWVSSAVEQPELESNESIENSSGTEPLELQYGGGWEASKPLEPECEEGWEASKMGLSNFHDVCIHSSEGDLDMPLHVVQNNIEISENNLETKLQSSDVMKSQEQVTDSNVHLLENMISANVENDSCVLEGETVISDVQTFFYSKVNESLVNTPEEATHTITHNATPTPENYEEGSAFLTTLDKISNHSPVPLRESVSQPIKIPPSLEKTLNSLPASPVGSVDIKGTALKLLGCLVEEQDKAMVRLLDDQRQQAEKMKERFKTQQKCLVERVAHLVSSLSTPRIRKSQVPHHSPLCGDTNLTHEENVTISKSPPMANEYLPFPEPLTPVQISKEPDDIANQLSRPTCSYQLELLSQLRPDNILGKIPSKDKVTELESELIQFSQKDDLPLVENTFCQVCLSVHSNCRCSQEESSCSSTIREEVTALSFVSLETGTVSVEGACDTECNTNEDKTICSRSPFQEANDGDLIHSSLKPETNVPVNPPLVKANFPNQDGVLDLSEILEMELGCRGGNILNHTPHKSKCKSEEIHGITTLSTSNSVKTINSSRTTSSPEELSSYRQMYEQDLQRLTSFESNAEKQSRNIDGLLENEPVSSTRGSPRSSENWTLTPDEISSLRVRTNEDEKRDLQFDMLPDLRSDILQAYLGSQTPSTGPVFLQTSIASAAPQCQTLPACSTPAELGANDTNGLPTNEVQYVNDGHSPSIISPVIREKLECKETLDLSPNELHLFLRSSSSSSGSLSFPREVSQPSSAKCPSSSNSHSSEHYTTASSKCQSEDRNRFEKSVLVKFGKLSALVKGYLTRRLLKTEKVRKIKLTIRDLMLTALKVHSEVSQEEYVNPNDVRLHGQILAELNTTCEEFHHLFFGMTRAQQMAIIAADRHRLMSASGSSAVVDEAEVITPRPALLSAVTLKTLQRRFSMYSPSNKVEGTTQYKCDGQQPTQRKISSVDVVTGQRMRKTVRGRERSSRAVSISEDNNSKSVSRNLKANRVPVAHSRSGLRDTNVQTKQSRRKRRSVSAGEMKRKPWR